jgi:hypothetical protein
MAGQRERQRTVRTRFRGGRETQGETSAAVRLRKYVRAIGFYERAGFAAIGETVFMVGPVPFRDLVYARNMG